MCWLCWLDNTWDVSGTTLLLVCLKWDDDLLSHDHYLSLRDSLRTRTDFYEGHGNQVNFPGRIAELDRLTVDPLVDALLSSEVLSQHFPPNIFDKEHVGGFASILCNPWGIHNGIHHDFADTQYENIKAPAAVFYFGFDGAKSQSKSTTGTAFFREKISGLERATSIDGNEKEFCLSIAIFNNLRVDLSKRRCLDVVVLPPAAAAAAASAVFSSGRFKCRNILFAYICSCDSLLVYH